MRSLSLLRVVLHSLHFVETRSLQPVAWSDAPSPWTSDPTVNVYQSTVFVFGGHVLERTRDQNDFHLQADPAMAVESKQPALSNLRDLVDNPMMSDEVRSALAHLC